MKNKRTFIFSWDMLGIESIICLDDYHEIDKQNTMRILKGQDPVRNPLNSVIQSLLLRARFNSQRQYEIYAIDCDTDLDRDFWGKQWDDDPQFTADLIRERGHKIYSDRLRDDQIKIR